MHISLLFHFHRRSTVDALTLCFFLRRYFPCAVAHHAAVSKARRLFLADHRFLSRSRLKSFCASLLLRVNWYHLRSSPFTCLMCRPNDKHIIYVRPLLIWFDRPSPQCSFRFWYHLCDTLAEVFPLTADCDVFLTHILMIVMHSLYPLPF